MIRALLNLIFNPMVNVYRRTAKVVFAFFDVILCINALLIVCAVVALVSLSYGAWMVYPPAGFIVPGILMWIEIPRRGVPKEKSKGTT